jgi:hypothetical protein
MASAAGGLWDPAELEVGEKLVKIGDEGQSFEAVVAIQILRWLSEDANKFHDFKFGVQLHDDADKFDDVVFGIQNQPNSVFKYSMIQLKFKSIESKYPNLKMQDIVHRHNPQDKSIPKCKPNICLKVYFDSYRNVAAKQLRKEGEFVDGTLENFVLLTNRSIVLENFKNIELTECPVSTIGNIFPGKCYKFSPAKASELMTSCNIPRDQLPEFKEFLTKLILSVGQPNDREINEFLKEKLGRDYSQTFCAIREFSLKWNRHKWIQKRQLFNRCGMFQGKPLKAMSEILQDDLYTDLNQETILKLITNSLEIGKPHEETESTKKISNTLEHLYIKRKFQMQNEIDPGKLELADKTNDEFHIQEEVEQQAVMSPRTDEPGASASSKNVHYFKRQNEKLFWERTEGRIDKVLEIRTKNQTIFKEKDLLRMDETKKINILAGEPGMGKSVAMSRLAGALKKDNLWVVPINLVDLSSSFKSAKNLATKEACLYFLINKCLKISTSFEKEVFKSRVHRVALLLDGFDEICPSYKEECFKWIEGLSQLNINQIWIATRSQLQSELEKKFLTIALTMSTFSEKNNMDFLHKYWRHKMTIEKTHRSVEIAKKLVAHVSSAISESKNVNSFIGIPLIMSMVAFIYRGQIDSFLEDPEKISFLGPVTLIRIYKEFVEQKFKTSISKHVPVTDQDKPYIAGMIDTERKSFLANHRLLAIYHLFQRIKRFKDLLKSLNISIETIHNLLKKVSNVEEKHGVIYNVQNETVTFMHKSFAEYLAADWFSHELVNSDGERKSQVSKFLKGLYFKREQTNFRKMFGLILAEGCQQPFLADLFRCVIHKNFFEVKQIINLHPETITETDPLGRNALHAAIETEEWFNPMSVFLIDQNKTQQIVYAKDILFARTPIEYMDFPDPDRHLWYARISELLCKPPTCLPTFDCEGFTNTSEAEEDKKLKNSKLSISTKFSAQSVASWRVDFRFFIFYFKYLLTRIHLGPELNLVVKEHLRTYLDRVSEMNDTKCKVCKEEKPNLKTCRACRSVKYCSAECHRIGWPNHKNDCKRFEQLVEIFNGLQDRLETARTTCRNF